MKLLRAMLVAAVCAAATPGALAPLHDVERIAPADIVGRVQSTTTTTSTTTSTTTTTTTTTTVPELPPDPAAPDG